MIDILESKREQIAAACKRCGVMRLDAFGSSVRHDFRPNASDIDLLVEFCNMDVYARVDAYFNLLNDFRRLLGAEIDLVMVDAIKNRYIASDIECTKELLYAACRARCFCRYHTSAACH